MEAQIGGNVEGRSPVGNDEFGVDLGDFVRYGRVGKGIVTKHTARRPQYNRLIKTSSGAHATVRAFLTAKSRGESRMSARRAMEKVKVESLSLVRTYLKEAIGSVREPNDS
jgi:hypothetical protein